MALLGLRSWESYGANGRDVGRCKRRFLCVRLDRLAHRGTRTQLPCRPPAASASGPNTTAPPGACGGKAGRADYMVILVVSGTGPDHRLVSPVAAEPGSSVGWYGSRTSLSGSCCGGLSLEAGSVVVPAGSGLVAASPPGPVQVVVEAVVGLEEDVEEAFDLRDGERDQPGILGWEVVGVGG
jgi:hypothetical protein